MEISELIDAGKQESNQLEYKSTEAHPEAIVKELVAFANSEGGMLLVGVREEDGEIVEVQDVDDPSGLEETIQDIISSQVEPRIRIQYTVEEHDGRTVVAFEVEEQSRPSSMEFNGKPTFPFRAGSRVDYYHGYDLQNLWANTYPASHSRSESEAPDKKENPFSDLTRNPEWNEGVVRSVSAGEIPSGDAPAYSAPEHRLITEVQDRSIVLFGRIGIDPLKPGSTIYQIKDYVDIAETNDMKEALDNIQAYLSSSTLSYSIKYEGRQLAGQGQQNLLKDMNRIREICERLVPAGKSMRDPRPIGVVSVPISGGICVIEIQWQGDSLRPVRSSAQILLQNIPLNTDPYIRFYDSIGASPREFQGKNRMQIIRINGSGNLSTTGSIKFRVGLNESYDRVLASNPFYNSPELLGTAIDQYIPAHFYDTISSLSQLPFEVAGGWSPQDPAHSFDSIETLSIDAMLETYVIEPLCRPTNQYDE